MDSAADLRRGYLFGFLGVVIFSLSLPGTRVAVAELGVEFVTAVRLAGAGALALILLLMRPSGWPSFAKWRLLFAVILGVVIGFPLFTGLAMRHVDASHGAVVLAILPLMTAIAGSALAGERPSSRFWLCALGGGATVFLFVLARSETGVSFADLYLVAAAVSAALGYASGGLLAREMPGLSVIAWALVASLPLVAPFVWFYWPQNLAEISARAWFGQATVTIGAQFLGFYFFYKGLALGGIARVGQIQLLQAYLTIAFGAILLDESIDISLIIAAVVTMVFVWLGRQMSVGNAKKAGGSHQPRDQQTRKA